MAILGTILFVLFFLALAPASREMIGNTFTNAGDWIVKWAPLSYAVLLLVLIVPVVAAIIVMKWPQPPEPEDPLARYKQAEDIIE